MLKITDVKLEKISDINMHLFIEKGMRGGISYIAKRYAKANNKYMKNYDPTKPSKYISYLDMNNLFMQLGNESISSLWWISVVKKC